MAVFVVNKSETKATILTMLFEKSNPRISSNLQLV